MTQVRNFVPAKKSAQPVSTVLHAFVSSSISLISDVVNYYEKVDNYPNRAYRLVCEKKNLTLYAFND